MRGAVQRDALECRGKGLERARMSERPRRPVALFQRGEKDGPIVEEPGREDGELRFLPRPDHFFELGLFRCRTVERAKALARSARFGLEGREQAAGKDMAEKRPLVARPERKRNRPRPRNLGEGPLSRATVQEKIAPQRLEMRVARELTLGHGSPDVEHGNERQIAAQLACGSRRECPHMEIAISREQDRAAGKRLEGSVVPGSRSAHGARILSRERVVEAEDGKGKF